MRAAVIAAALTMASPALADGDGFEGVACETSLECGALHCIEGSCHDPLVTTHVETRAGATLGHRAMFGSGRGYGALVAAMDLGAAAIEPLIMLASSKSSGEMQTMFGILCFVPVGLTGSTTHFVHGRVVPGIISFFAWTSLAATTFVVAGLAGLGNERSGGEFNNDAAWAAGLVFGAVGAAGLAWLDAWMARTVTRKEQAVTTVRWAPSVAPTRGGFVAELGASF